MSRDRLVHPHMSRDWQAHSHRVPGWSADVLRRLEEPARFQSYALFWNPRGDGRIVKVWRFSFIFSLFVLVFSWFSFCSHCVIILLSFCYPSFQPVIRYVPLKRAKEKSEMRDLSFLLFSEDFRCALITRRVVRRFWKVLSQILKTSDEISSKW